MFSRFYSGLGVSTPQNYTHPPNKKHRNLSLKRDRFEPQSRAPVQSEHNVHILHRLSARSLEQVVDNARNQKPVAVLFHVQEALVGIDNLLQA